MVANDDANEQVSPGQKVDPEAFEELIRKFQKMIHSVCYRMTGSQQDAEDLAQETFLLAYRHLDGFKGQSRISSWIYQIAINQCLNWQKRVRRRQQLHQEWGEQLETSSLSSSPALAQQIQPALMKLSAKQRAAIVLTIYQGLTHAEAAKAVGCSETTISWRLFAARRRLKSILQRMPTDSEKV
jgi:RNA polymerase sigma-70 factor (ECF subfamily)